MTSSGVPVGDTTLPQKILKTALESWLRDVPPGASAGVWFADALDALDSVVTLIEAAQKVRNTVQGLDDADHVHGNCPRCRRALTKRVAALDAALAPFVGEATQ